MSSATAEGLNTEYVTIKPRRMKRLVKRTKDTVKSIGSIVAKTCKTVWRSTIKTVKAVARGSVRTVGSVLSLITGLLNAVARVAGFVLLVAAMTVAVVVGLALALIVGVVYTLIYLVQHYLYEPSMWLASDKSVSLSNYQGLRREARRMNTESSVSRWMSFFGGDSDLDVETITDETITAENPNPSEAARVKPEYDWVLHPEVEEEWPTYPWDQQNPHGQQLASAISEKAHEQLKKDTADLQAAFPGARVMYASLDHLYESMHTDFIPDTYSMKQYKIWREQEIGTGEDRTLDKFDWSQYQTEDLEVTYEHLSQSGNLHVRSYFLGRLSILRRYMANPACLDRQGQYWGLLHKEMQSKQDKYSLKVMRAGYYDQVKDLMTGTLQNA